MTRERDLGRQLRHLGERLEDEGQATSQRFHDWRRTERLEADSSRGGGHGGATFDPRDRQQDRHAGRMFAEWATIRGQLDQLTARANWLMDQAKAAGTSRTKDWTPAQAEAEGWCGSCWRLGKQVPVQCRPTGEPYVRGRCRFCRGWPNHLPALDDLRTHHAGRTVWTTAS